VLIDNHGQIRGHSRFEFELRIIHSNDNAICHDILNRLRFESNFGNLAVEHIGPICVDGKGHLNVIRDLSDIGFVDVGLHLHVRQIVGDQKQRRRRQTRSNGLADVDTPGNHDSVNRRINLGQIEIDLCTFQLGLGSDNIGLR